MAPPLHSAPWDQAQAAGSETRLLSVAGALLLVRGAATYRIVPAPARAGPTLAAAPSRERGSGVFAWAPKGGVVLSINTFPS